MDRKKIVLTGGGTAGHVTPNIALLPRLQKLDYEIFYIGSYEGIEKKLISDFCIPYYGIATGKFRRYFDPKNFSDPFRVLKGIGESKKILKQIKPDIVFSKGGFVSVPVIRAAHSLKIPCIIHESDLTPGLANKLCISAASKICCNFPETLGYLPQGKAVLTGSPIREELLAGDAEKARALCGFDDIRPVILVMGGSQGASAINKVIREALDRLLKDFQIIHICGRDKMDNLLIGTRGYKQFEYVRGELKDLFALSDLVVSRAGANAICELLALRIPNLLIPAPECRFFRVPGLFHGAQRRKPGRGFPAGFPPCPVFQPGQLHRQHGEEQPVQRNRYHNEHNRGDDQKWVTAFSVR